MLRGLLLWHIAGKLGGFSITTNVAAAAFMRCFWLMTQYSIMLNAIGEKLNYYVFQFFRL